MTVTKDSYTEAVNLVCDELKKPLLSVPESKRASVQEIRLRVGKPLTLTDGTSVLLMDKAGKLLYTISENAVMVSQRQLFDTFRRICGYSVYSVQNEIKNGFVTVRGGHRVGLCGTASLSSGRITAISDISSLNIRIARQIHGVSEELLKKLLPFDGGVLIAGPPSSGKTTLLKDIALRLSTGTDCKMMRTTVIDERGEISGTSSGMSGNDLGLCDVLNGYPKGEGILHAIRSLSPQVIICDEVGTDEDCRAVSAGFNAGAVIVATIHAADMESLFRRPQAKALLASGAFSDVVMLESSDRPCRIKAVRKVTEQDLPYHGENKPKLKEIPFSVPKMTL